MAYQFTQTGAEIQDILNQVGDNTSDISALDTRLTTAEGEIANIGTVVRSNNGSASSVSLAANTPANVCSISLPAGTWILTGQGMFSNVESGQRVFCISTASASFTNQARSQFVTGGTTGSCGMNVSMIATISSTTTYYLVAQSAIACDIQQCFLNAIRIA